MAQPVHITRLPGVVLESIIANSDRAAWRLVSKQFATLASSPWVKSEWLAVQADILSESERQGSLNLGDPSQKTEPTRFECTCGAWISNAQLAPLRTRDRKPDWDNAFLEHCDKENLESDTVYHPHIPAAHSLIKIPSNHKFVDYAVIHSLYERHRDAFHQLKEFLLCWSAFWQDEEATCFCLDKGASVDYAHGWVLARLACDRKTYHKEMVRKLVFEYGAKLDFNYHNDKATNVLGAVLIYHDDHELARALIAKSRELIHNNGDSIVVQAAEKNNLNAVRFLLEHHRVENPSSVRVAVQELVKHVKTWGGSGDLMQMLAIEYKVDIDIGPDALWSAIRNQERASVDFSLIQWYLDHGAILQAHELIHTIGQEALFLFLCSHARSQSFSSRTEFPWLSVLQAAIAMQNLEAVTILLDGGYWDIHADNDIALRSVCRTHASPPNPPVRRSRPPPRHRTGVHHTLVLCDNYFTGPRPWSTRFKDRSILLFLLERGADIHANREEALRSALRQGDVLTVLFLLEHGALIGGLPREPWEFTDGATVLLPLAHGAEMYINKPWKEMSNGRMNGPLRALSLVLEVAERLGLCGKEPKLRIIRENGSVFGRGNVMSLKGVWTYDPEFSVLDDRDPLEYLKSDRGYLSFSSKAYKNRINDRSNWQRRTNRTLNRYRATGTITKSKGLWNFIGMEAEFLVL
ncbi:hypothetical protein BC936DRAFT_138593 [Jimgerdemannia flammicorona]|uniref:Uncharacterized protein n=1 Tax=Jimgerdemannia flammicorona TaxID=994334 RepID=A0A433C139_9FUNG|nr:hypothetical protein BC936DRAFT_138593 [Jimgerdemannia flammicorona]